MNVLDQCRTVVDVCMKLSDILDQLRALGTVKGKEEEALVDAAYDDIASASGRLVAFIKIGDPEGASL